MQIERTYKKTSLKFGQTVVCDEETFSTVARQTQMGQHQKGECGKDSCTHCPEVALGRLMKGATVESFFSKFKLIET